MMRSFISSNLARNRTPKKWRSVPVITVAIALLASPRESSDTRRISAPNVAIPIERRSSSRWSTVPQPSRVPISPPSIAPTMPRKIVKMQPAGSRPGMRNFASEPAMRPSNNQKSHRGMTNDRGAQGRKPVRSAVTRTNSAYTRRPASPLACYALTVARWLQGRRSARPRRHAIDPQQHQRTDDREQDAPQRESVQPGAGDHVAEEAAQERTDDTDENRDDDSTRVSVPA